MPAASAVILTVLAVALLVAAVFLFRSDSDHPWSAIGVAAIASAVCFTVGGEAGGGTPGPSVGTVLGGVVGLLSVVAGIIALVPRPGDRPAPRSPILIAVAAIVVGAAGLLFSQLAG